MPSKKVEFIILTPSLVILSEAKDLGFWLRAQNGNNQFGDFLRNYQ
jgi:hypothetical protein